MKATKTLSLFLSAILLFCACSSKRKAGFVITAIGAVAVAGGIVAANYHCNTDETDPLGSKPACEEGNPEYGYSVAGVGLLIAAFGVYLLATARDDDEDEEVAQWPDGVPEIPEIRGPDRL